MFAVCRLLKHVTSLFSFLQKYFRKTIVYSFICSKDLSDADTSIFFDFSGPLVIYGVTVTFESLNEFRILIFWALFKGPFIISYTEVCL